MFDELALLFQNVTVGAAVAIVGGLAVTLTWLRDYLRGNRVMRDRAEQMQQQIDRGSSDRQLQGERLDLMDGRLDRLESKLDRLLDALLQQSITKPN